MDILSPLLHPPWGIVEGYLPRQCWLQQVAPVFHRVTAAAQQLAAVVGDEGAAPSVGGAPDFALGVGRASLKGAAAAAAACRPSPAHELAPARVEQTLHGATGVGAWSAGRPHALGTRTHESLPLSTPTYPPPLLLHVGYGLHQALCYHAPQPGIANCDRIGSRGCTASAAAAATFLSLKVGINVPQVCLL